MSCARRGGQAVDQCIAVYLCHSFPLTSFLCSGVDCQWAIVSSRIPNCSGVGSYMGCSCAWSISSLSFSDVVVCTPAYCSFFSSSSASSIVFALSYIRYHKMPPGLLMDSAMSSSRSTETVWKCPCTAEDRDPWSLLTEATSAALLWLKACYLFPIHHVPLASKNLQNWSLEKKKKSINKDISV